MQEQSEILPSKCPVCGSKILLPSNRQTCEPTAHPMSGVLSYRCENGHVFLPSVRIRDTTPCT